VTLPTREDTDFRRAQLKRLTRTAALTAGGIGAGRHVLGLLTGLVSTSRRIELDR